MGSGKRNPRTVSKSWTQALAGASFIKGKPPPPGEGWLTRQELSEGVLKDLGKEKLSKFLKELKASDRLESFTGSAYSETAGGCFRQVWYRIREKE